ncbi:hypothetical protein AB1Y20_013404 [Prymnesium parvum]|uniref:Fanconi-associated nuclease n=1 Tax=Prymnesium parvum TaxID=97485 RepID=A0AB34IGA9_PRYPA
MPNTSTRFLTRVLGLNPPPPPDAYDAFGVSREISAHSRLTLLRLRAFLSAAIESHRAQRAWVTATLRQRAATRRHAVREARVLVERHAAAPESPPRGEARVVASLPPLVDDHGEAREHEREELRQRAQQLLHGLLGLVARDLVASLPAQPEACAKGGFCSPLTAPLGSVGRGGLPLHDTWRAAAVRDELDEAAPSLSAAFRRPSPPSAAPLTSASPPTSVATPLAASPPPATSRPPATSPPPAASTSPPRFTSEEPHISALPTSSPPGSPPLSTSTSPPTSPRPTSTLPATPPPAPPLPAARPSTAPLRSTAPAAASPPLTVAECVLEVDGIFLSNEDSLRSWRPDRKRSRVAARAAAGSHGEEDGMPSATGGSDGDDDDDESAAAAAAAAAAAGGASAAFASLAAAARATAARLSSRAEAEECARASAPLFAASGALRRDDCEAWGLLGRVLSLVCERFVHSPPPRWDSFASWLFQLAPRDEASPLQQTRLELRRHLIAATATPRRGALLPAPRDGSFDEIAARLLRAATRWDSEAHARLHNEAQCSLVEVRLDEGDYVSPTAPRRVAGKRA